MKNNIKLIGLALLACVVLSSCAGQSIVLKPNYDFSKIKRVAVLEFEDAPYVPNSGSMVSQLFIQHLLSAGYNVIERDELNALLRERQLTMQGIISNPDQAQEFGKISGIDAFVVGSITECVPPQDIFEGGGMTRYVAAQVGVVCRMVSVDTGEILWAGSDTYDSMNMQTAFDYLIGSLVNELVGDIRAASPKN
jgi:curli biogenesis system outer membrane secretion channel CsgG